MEQTINQDQICPTCGKIARQGNRFYFLSYRGEYDEGHFWGSLSANCHPFKAIQKLNERIGHHYVLLGWREITEEEFLLSGEVKRKEEKD